jgi:hypothetical protein
MLIGGIDMVLYKKDDSEIIDRIEEIADKSERN